MERMFYELQEVLAQPGCPLCFLRYDTERRYFDTLFYELVNDYETRQKVIHSGGFCPEHTAFIFQERHSVLGIAIIYHDLLGHTLTSPTSETHCPLCAHWREKESHLFRLLEKQWGSLHEHWGKQTFFCQLHLRTITNERLKEEITQYTRQALQEIRTQLTELIEKFDYRHAYLPLSPGIEWSWQEALEFFASRTLIRERHKR